MTRLGFEIRSLPVAGMFRELILVTLLLLAIAAYVHAADRAPASDPLAAETFGTTWLWREAVWTTDAGRSEGWGGRAQAQLGLGRVGLAVRADVGGLPGSFDLENPATFRAASLYFALHLNAIVREGIILGPTAFVGRALSLEGGSTSAPTLGQMTVGAGLRVAGRGGAAYVAIGTHEALGGLCMLGTAHLPLTSRLAAVIDAAVSADGRAYVRLGMAVVLATGGS